MGCGQSKATTASNTSEGFRGAVKLRIIFDETSSTLTIRMKQARNVLALDFIGTSDVFAKVLLSGEGNENIKLQTSVKQRTTNPIWDEELRCVLTPEENQDTLITFSVWDRDFHSRNDFIGSFTIPLKEILGAEEQIHGWFELLDKARGAKEAKFLGTNWQPSMCTMSDFSCEVPTNEVADSDSEEDDVSQGSQEDFNRLSSINAPATTSNKQEWKAIMKAAEEVGKERTEANMKPRHITVIYNPVSGNGTAKKMVDKLVTPVLRAAKVEHDVIPTQYAGHATEFMLTLDLDSTDGILVAGGDGLVHEVITGYCLRKDNGGGKPVGIVPSGTANAMAHQLHQQKNHSNTSVVGRAALCAARGSTRQVDVLKIGTLGVGDDVYALSVLGWGLAGAVALQAAKLRWIPGQKRVRYDFAGFLTMIKKWPVISKAKMSFLTEGEDGEEKWVSEELETVNMLITNLPELGQDHPIIEGLELDDGYFGLVTIAGDTSRKKVISLAMHMKKGLYMASHSSAKAYKVKEVKLEPHIDSKIPFNADGDPLDATAVHIECLHKHLTVFADQPIVIPPEE